jgi:hypothetical protein
MKSATIVITVSAQTSDSLEDFAENLATSLEPFIGEHICDVSIDEAIGIAIPEDDECDLIFGGVYLKSIKSMKVD